ncbi:CAP domain-containing protein [Halobaculum gomorrense]|uniref:Uncharacterized conserved protein YkwD, contains CAP (CSP/antigen 5/PR1) domain n=1 Tax=Halobaculum gomorrense TaxID=43928 RepID=A0A1M5UJ42_9EURY|nr:CAP domain-containing protein [Halobaculum gomorrense]SHH63054.1 Uncharacterized conserved protein YkwD, contains CAP (CSP/antigen 5/PR1) domain [Halobaculum gomorrense]
MIRRRAIATVLVVIAVASAGCLSGERTTAEAGSIDAHTPAFGSGEHTTVLRYGHNQSDSSVVTPKPLDRKTPRTDVNVTQIERLLAEKLNDYRAVDDAQPLVSDPRLAVIARNHSYDMATREFFNHTNPDGVTYDDRLRRSEYLCSGGAENIHATFWKMERKTTEKDMAREILYSFMRSADHNTAMIRPDLTTVGIGIYITADRRTYVTMALCDGTVESDPGDA